MFIGKLRFVMMILLMKKKLLIALSIAIMLIVAIVFFILNRSTATLSEKEKEQALSKILDRPVVLKEKNIPTGDVAYKGKYMTFSYPASAVKYVQMVNGKPIKSLDLEDFSFDMDNPKMYIVTVVLPASAASSVSDNSGVRMRQSDASYKETKIAADGQNGLAFEKLADNNFEKIGFFLVGGKFYSFSIQSVDPKAAGDLFNRLILTLKFL
jgi:hypothetical protein